ncbi:hypothetical protein Hanom_Chr10g00877631 [Helianthus anomalus]
MLQTIEYSIYFFLFIIIIISKAVSKDGPFTTKNTKGTSVYPSYHLHRVYIFLSFFFLFYGAKMTKKRNTKTKTKNGK